MSWKDWFSDAWDLAKKGQSVQLEKKLLEATEEIVRLGVENLELRTKVAELEKRAELKAKLEYDGTAYWVCEPDGKKGPYCPNCWEVDDKLVHLRDFERTFCCHNCELAFDKPDAASMRHLVPRNPINQ